MGRCNRGFELGNTEPFKSTKRHGLRVEGSVHDRKNGVLRDQGSGHASNGRQ